MTNEKEIVWGVTAAKQFKEAIDYIGESSVQNAQNVKTILLKQIQRLLVYPEIYSLDKYKQNNDGNYRAFEKYHLRISYYITEKQIRILRVRHTKRKPLKY